MSLNLSWLDDFLALAASGNFSRAADERHMTQPAFSRRIRALEEWLGTPLFDRSSQPATLTAAGEWFRDSAHGLLAEVARLPNEARAVAEEHSTSLRFAATHALSFTFLTRWLRNLETLTSLGPISLVSDVLARCEAMLVNGQVQFVMAHAHLQSPGKLQDEDYAHLRVGGDTLIPVSAPEKDGRPRHGLEGASAAHPVQMLTYSEESGIGRILRDVKGAALQRFPAQTVFTAHLASVLRTMALDGGGMAWLPQTLIADDLAAGRLVDAAPAEWRIEMDIRLYRDRASLGTAGNAFWAAACDFASANESS